MKYLKLFSLHFIIFSIILIPVFVLAEDPPPHTAASQPITIKNPFKAGDNLFDLLKTILNDIIMPIAAVFIVVWIIYAGFQFVIAQGNPAALSKARSNLLWSLIGAGILLGAAGISAVVQSTVNSLRS